MAVKYYLIYCILVSLLNLVKAEYNYSNFNNKRNENLKTTKIDKTGFNITAHLDAPNVKKVCLNRVVFCRSNASSVCTLRHVNKTVFYKQFDNTCYLFLSNMCDHPGKEFHILNAGSCYNGLTLRRNDEEMENISNEASTDTDVTTSENDKITTDSNDTASNDNSPILRNVATTITLPKYSYSGRPCPHSCTNVYKPVCLNVNEDFGKYFKMFTFVNECKAQLFYCLNPSEFKQPPGSEYEDDPGAFVQSSDLSWSYCAASSFIQYNNFAKMTSSMGHYGFLAGQHPYRHILKPEERLPNYG